MDINTQKIQPRNLVVRWIISIFSFLAISLSTNLLVVSGLKDCIIFASIYVFAYSLVMMLSGILTIYILEKIKINMIIIVIMNIINIILDYIVFVFSLFLLMNKGIIEFKRSYLIFIICFILQVIGIYFFKGGKKEWQKNQYY